MAIAADEFKSVMSRWASGVTVVTTCRERGIHGMTASSFCSVSLEPPLILVCVDRRTRTHAYLEQQAAFGVNLLRADQQEISDLAAGFRGERGNLLEGIPYRTAITGAPVLENCLAWLDCSRWRDYEGGDHTIFVGLVEAGSEGEGQPLLWCRRGYAGLGRPE